MAITQIDVRAGDPTIQASGQYRGTVDALFDDGTALSLQIRAQDSDEWNDRVAGAGDELERIRIEQDANSAVDPEKDIEESGYSSKAKTCVAYIRRAWESGYAVDAHALYVRINTFVTQNSGWAAVKPLLLAEGLTDEEFEQARDAYQYLSGSGRPAIMTEARDIQGAWEGLH